LSPNFFYSVLIQVIFCTRGSVSLPNTIVRYVWHYSSFVSATLQIRDAKLYKIYSLASSHFMSTTLWGKIV